jgi:dienelactone hydrolase
MDRHKPARAPCGELASYARDSFTHAGSSHDLYRKGTGPAVIVITELPGITPRVLGFADRVAAIGCSVTLPDLYGQAGRDPFAGGDVARALYGLRSLASVCVSREFTLLARGRSSPVVAWLRGLARHEHARCGGPGMGVVGMCFSGGFALALASEAPVLAPVVSQPSLPLPINRTNAKAIDCSAGELAQIRARCAAEGLHVLGLRFRGDPVSPDARFAHLKEQLGECFVAVEIAQADGHPEGPMRKHHSVLTEDMIDEPGSPTREALERVLDLFREKLLVSAARTGSA